MSKKNNNSKNNKNKSKTDTANDSELFNSAANFTTSSPTSPVPILSHIPVELFRKMSMNNESKGFPLMPKDNDTIMGSPSPSPTPEPQEKAIFVHKKKHPAEQLDEQEMNFIIKVVMDKRNEVVKKNPESVRITNVITRNGYLKFVCENDQTLSWVKNGFQLSERTDLGCGDRPPAQVAVTRCAIRVKSIFLDGLEFKDVVEELTISNPGLKLDGARYYNTVTHGFNKTMYIGIEETTKQWLIAHGGIVQFKLQQTRIMFDEIKELLNEPKKRKIQ